MKYYQCKQNENSSLMKESLSVSNEAASSSIDVFSANNEAFDEPPAKKESFSNSLLNQTNTNIWKMRNYLNLIQK